jgi:hypothetical protein
MQDFYIVRGSLNPVLEMELIADGRYDFQKSLINDAIQDSIVTFSMIEEETGLLKISKANANIVLEKNDGCDEKYILQYKWDKRDVSKPGVYKGWFEITFNGNIKNGDGTEYPTGNLIVPIEEELRIYIR